MNNEKRVFVGIDLSFQFTKLIPMLKTTIEDKNEDIRWVSGRNLHLTLSFLGNIEDDKIQPLIEALKEVETLKKIDVSVNNTGVFPNEGNPRIFWLGVDEGYDAIADIQSIVDEISTEFKENQREEKFVPHVTIGRIANKKKTIKLDVSTFLNTVYSPIEFIINKVYLYESKLTQDGPRYSVLSEFRLQ
jgi:2'-5' RNA ligase